MKIWIPVCAILFCVGCQDGKPEDEFEVTIPSVPERGGALSFKIPKTKSMYQNLTDLPSQVSDPCSQSNLLRCPSSKTREIEVTATKHSGHVIVQIVLGSTAKSGMYVLDLGYYLASRDSCDACQVSFYKEGKLEEKKKEEADKPQLIAQETVVLPLDESTPLDDLLTTTSVWQIASLNPGGSLTLTLYGDAEFSARDLLSIAKKTSPTLFPADRITANACAGEDSRLDVRLWAKSKKLSCDDQDTK